MPPEVSPTSPVLSVIIVSYNTRRMTLDCLRTLYADLGDLSAEVFVVDNASTDDSVEAVRAQFPGVHLIANQSNVGFGAANNQAMKLARGRYFLLLNSDAFLKPGAVAALVSGLDSQPGTGAIGPKLLNADGSLQISCYKFPSPFRAWVENLWLSAAMPGHPTIGDYRKWPHDSPRKVDWIVGACILLRREVFERVGGFDEKFFMYAEESDWQLRIREAGWDIAFTPSAQVIHLGGASGAKEPVRINHHFFQSLDYYELKHHGLAGLISLRLAMGVGCSLRLCLWWIAFAFVPRKREIARQKARLHAWLAGRQLSFWNIAKVRYLLSHSASEVPH
jgi:GT2 family glycosyltransferase